MAEAWRRKIGTGERWTETEARAALAAWEASGEALTTFSRKAGVQAQRLAWWRERLGRTAALVPVTVTGTLGGGAVLTIGAVRVEVADLEQVSPVTTGLIGSHFHRDHRDPGSASAWVAKKTRAVMLVGDDHNRA